MRNLNSVKKEFSTQGNSLPKLNQAFKLLSLECRGYDVVSSDENFEGIR